MSIASPMLDMDTSQEDMLVYFISKIILFI